MNNKSLFVLFAASVLGLFSTLTIAEESVNPNDMGKHLILIAGCNDCHTSGYAPSGGQVPESEWLLGDNLGYRGPWGTTYPINLREYVSKLSEAEWVAKAKTLQARPPMPWWALNNMSDEELKAVYQYIRGLGEKSSKVPAFLPPNKKPKPPFIQWPAPPKK